MLNGSLNLWSARQSTMIEDQYLMVTRQLEHYGDQKNLPFPSLSTFQPHALISRVSLSPCFTSRKTLQLLKTEESQGTHYLSFHGDVKIPETPPRSFPGGIPWRKLDLRSEKHTPSTVTLLVIIKYSISKREWYEKNRDDEPCNFKKTHLIPLHGFPPTNRNFNSLIL